MPLKHDHPKYGLALLELLNERCPGFHPLREMEKMLNDPATPPKLKKSLRREIDAYTVPKLKPSSKGVRG